VLRGNYVHDNKGPGLWLDGNNIYALYEGNRVVDNYGPGIDHEISYDAVIRNNVVEGNGFGWTGWVDGAGILVNTSPNVEVYGNTVRNNNDGIAGIHASRGSGNYGPYQLKNLWVHDNVIVMQVGETGVVTNTSDPVFSTAWNNRFDYNTYTLGSADKYYAWDPWYMTTTQWRATGQDPHSTWTDEGPSGTTSTTSTVAPTTTTTSTTTTVAAPTTTTTSTTTTVAVRAPVATTTTTTAVAAPGPVATTTTTTTTTVAAPPAPTGLTEFLASSLLLRWGSSGLQVTGLQGFLAQQGYSVGVIDGRFGRFTQAAVIAFQRAQGLVADGLVGNATRNAVRALVGSAPTTTTTSVPAAPVATTTNTVPASTPDDLANLLGSTNVLRWGSRGSAVSELQGFLAGRGYRVGSIDGIFGSLTNAAVIAFQRAQTLVADGVVGTVTRNAIRTLTP
jgi:parallel beta-helix repeat protein